MAAIRWSAALGAALALATPGLGQVISDTEFAVADWQVIPEIGNGSQSATQVAVGGNPGNYRRVDHLSFTNIKLIFHIFTPASYSPSVSGALDRVNFGIDQIAILNHAGIGVGTAPAIRQNGINYLPTSFLINSTFAWQTLSMNNLTAANFSVSGNPTLHPDFSSAGSSLLFGFATANDNGGAMVSRAAGYDNWGMTLVPVPEPTGLCCLSVASGFGITFRRISRRWSVSTSG